MAKIGSRRWTTLLFAANHQAVPAIGTPDPAASPGIDIVNTLGLEFARATNIVHVVRIAAVNDGVAGLHVRGKIVQSLIDRGCGDHQPGSTRRLQFGHEILE